MAELERGRAVQDLEGRCLMGVTEEAGKVADTAVRAMTGQPLAIALLIVNTLFLGLIAYILGEVAGNEGERAKATADLIGRLVTDIRDCRSGPKPTSFSIDYPASFQ